MARLNFRDWAQALMARLTRREGSTIGPKESAEVDARAESNPQQRLAEAPTLEIGDDNELREALQVRSSLLFWSSPLILTEPQEQHPYSARPEIRTQAEVLSSFQARFFQRNPLDEVARSFIRPVTDQSAIDLSLDSELATLIRVTYSFANPVEMIEDDWLIEFSDSLDVDRNGLGRIVDEVDKLRNRAKSNSYDETPIELRGGVQNAVFNLLIDDTGRRIVRFRNVDPSCTDDAGDGLEVLIFVAFGGTGPLPLPNDPTEPEQWPRIFPQGWDSVDVVLPWIPGSYTSPQITGRAATIRETVRLPSPFDMPVHLNVERREWWAEPTAHGVRHIALSYSLALPHQAMSVDEGFIALMALGDEPIGQTTEWRGYVGKRLILSSESYAAFSQLVCPHWLALVSRI